MSLLLWCGIAFILPPILFVLYIWLNDRKLTSLPADARAFSPTRCTPDSIRSLAAQLAESPAISINEQLPPKTGRRYIVVGGGGFLGGWIVSSLLERGEDPLHIRIVDIRAPVREDLASIPFIQLDVSDATAVHAAFTAPWPSSSPFSPELTIFHTAANIRFYERHPSLLPPSTRVNVLGTSNVLAAARAAGASILIYTSSGSIAVRSSRFLLWPWESAPEHFIQVLNDDEKQLPKRHEDFFSNYAVTKMQADQLVRAADGSSSEGGKVLRTGCIRPGNGVYGPRGDMLCGAYLVRGTNPTWISNILQSFCYVENCALAHLLYEQRLIDLLSPEEEKKKNPDIGGQAFMIADPGPIPTYGDVYATLTELTDGECTFVHMQPTLMLLVAYMIEAYYLSRHFFLSSGYPFFKLAATLLPPIKGDIINLQPSLFALTSVHLIFDDSRARLPPEKGGLGYKGAWTTMEGLYKTAEEHRNGVGRAGRRSDLAGVSLGFGFGKAERGVKKASEKLADGVGVDPVKILASVAS
ncbi:3 beta-hydroxysteroid dehydrogenase/Delta 5--_4-isomerase type 2 [Hypsizygus marmoreus]|uniref:3 beta-hydroxysteroid dehydrogenase/Delta 5-->4-isomerase type 2 n=1 Tax=Hypsizygus marmoreus TaxID=39966 RepID=A0A369K9T5_HYPMA|nr:3 beta-hydroxysteroid dehydrogenase/Delta 5-->4-isomerase type 2 [Hypsizygus marmoreus]